MVYKCKKCRSARIEIDNTYKYHDIYTCRDCNHLGYFKIEECCRKAYRIVTIQHYNNELRALYFQCLNCFGAEKTKALNSKGFAEQIRGEFNQYRFEEWKAERQKEGNEIYEGIKNFNYKNSDYYRYQLYLLSIEWKEKRKLILERDKDTCQFCRAQPAVEVHHLHYNNLFNEPLEDLRSVCLDCHRLIHHKSRGSVNP